jgi:hypothetical protein
MAGPEDVRDAARDLSTEVGPAAPPGPWYEHAAGWEALAEAFIRLELPEPGPDYKSFAEKIASCSAAERHDAWIRVAHEAPTKMSRTRAYVEALHNDPEPDSVAWSWLDGRMDTANFPAAGSEGGTDVTDRVEHVLGADDPHTPTTVDSLRDRLGSIVLKGGLDLPARKPDPQPAAEPAAQPAAEPAAQPAAEPAAQAVAQPAAEAAEQPAPEPAAQAVAEPAAVPVVEPAAAPAAEPAAAGPVAEPASQPAPEPAAQAVAEPAAVPVVEPAAQAVAQPIVAQPPGATPVWTPTHLVPAGGMWAWASPDPSHPPIVALAERLPLVVEGVAGDWAQVCAVNGWRGWVDGRLLVRLG